MLDLAGLFQWERFITPSIIRVFYGLAVSIVLLLGLSGIMSAFAAMGASMFAGLLMLVASLLGIAFGIVLARIVSEFILIAFRINEHLGAIRDGAGL